MKSITKTAILLSVSAAILAAMIWFSNPLEIWKVLKTTNLYWFSAGIGIWTLTFMARTTRWNMLLREIKIKIPFKDLISLYTIGKAVSNITPSRAGDLVKIFLLKKKFGHSFSVSLTSVVMEKIGDGLALFSILIIGGLLPFSPIPSKWILAAFILLTVIALTMLKITSTRKSKRRIGKRLMKYFMIRKSNKPGKLTRKMKKFRETFKNYSKTTMAVGLLLSIAIWLMDGIVLWMSFKAIGVDISLFLSILAVPVIMLVGVISLLPGGVGSSELTSVLFFVTFAGIAAPQAVAGTLLSRVIMWWLYMVGASVVFSTTYKITDIIKLMKKPK